MKQIIFKILTVAILSVFVLTLFCFDTILAANFTNNNSSSSGGFYIRSVSSDESVASSAKSEDNNPYTNPGESTTGFEQPSTNNDQNNDGTNDAFEIDNPADYQTMKAMKGGSDTSGGKYIYTLLQPLPKEGDDLSENVTLEEYLTWAFRFVLALAGFLAVMMIVIGGVEYIISGASESMRGEAKKRIENAIWGLVMALVSYLVLYTINPSLVNFKDNQFFKEKTTTTSEE